MGDDARQRRQAAARLGLAHQHQRGGAVGDRRGLAGVTVPSLRKAASVAGSWRRRTCPAFVVGEHHVALAAGDGHRGDFGAEAPLVTACWARRTDSTA
jgi:hypothetical protein